MYYNLFIYAHILHSQFYDGLYAFASGLFFFLRCEARWHVAHDTMTIDSGVVHMAKQSKSATGDDSEYGFWNEGYQINGKHSEKKKSKTNENC